MCSKSTMNAFALGITNTLYGNPHSGTDPSQLSTARIEEIRFRLLSFFKADPLQYSLVFVANATAGIKLVCEALRATNKGFLFAYHQACHTSVVGVREEALESVCVDSADVQHWIEGQHPFSEAKRDDATTLFAYTAQSHLNGERYPLSWTQQLRRSQPRRGASTLTMLDAASLGASSPLDMSHSDFRAHFTIVSLYKIFGFPDLGALIVRRDAESIFDHRRYFGGGTVDMVTCGKEQWHEPKTRSLYERLEDGTLPFHNILALQFAMETHILHFESMHHVSMHTGFLSKLLMDGIQSLRHGNGRSAAVLYKPGNRHLTSGPIVAFNLINSAGGWVSLVEFEKLANLKKMYVRTGSMCSPGKVAKLLGLEPWEVKNNFLAGVRCGSNADIGTGKPNGVIRASFGAMSIESDVRLFLDFLREFYVGSSPSSAQSLTVPLQKGEDCQDKARHRVKEITVYPIKSCAGFNIPQGVDWEIRPEGLVWDREWCLLQKGSNQALNQKRCPAMALVQPSLDLDNQVLRIERRGRKSRGAISGIEIPLSDEPQHYINSTTDHGRSRVCGESISAKIYASSAIHDFFSEALGIACVLARFPPGGQGLTSRTSKLRVADTQSGQCKQKNLVDRPLIPSPPDSDAEQQVERRILLANESPILLINSSSVDALNRSISATGGRTAEEAAFRANVVVESTSDSCHSMNDAYSEDLWAGLQISGQKFELLGGCQRCQMVCVDQNTGEKNQEPFVTMAKTRRYNGKVYFGVHMRHRSETSSLGSEQRPSASIKLGDPVMVQMRNP